MTGRELRYEGNVLSAFVSMIAGAIGIGLPLALLIIWVCS
jgi:hypothetical protein